MGSDKIHPIVLRLCADSFAGPLYRLFSTCLEQGTIPHEWKVHRTCPVPKTQNKLPVENYRPICLLCIPGKVLERIIYYNACLSCSHFSPVFEELDHGAAADIVYLDFKKAFDSVPHDELLFKLWKIGITGQLWHWFRAYFSDGQHYVKIDQFSQERLKVVSLGLYCF